MLEQNRWIHFRYTLDLFIVKKKTRQNTFEIRNKTVKQHFNIKNDCTAQYIFTEHILNNSIYQTMNKTC